MQGAAYGHFPQAVLAFLPRDKLAVGRIVHIQQGVNGFACEVRQGIPDGTAVHIVHLVFGSKAPGQHNHILRLSQQGDGAFGTAASGPFHQHADPGGICHDVIHQADGFARGACLRPA